MTHAIRQAPTKSEKMIVINYDAPDAQEVIDVAMALGARRIPAGGLAIMPIRLRHWELLCRHGFTAKMRSGGWRYYRLRDKRPITLYEALAAAHKLEDMVHAFAD